MTLYEITTQLHAGTVVSIIVIILSLVEVTPIPLHPLEWIGKRVNKTVTEQVATLQSEIEKVDGKLNNHMVGSYRTQILDFSDCVMGGQVYTHDKWRTMLRVCAEYEEMIEKEHLINGDATEAIEFIRFKYKEVAQKGNFVTLPIVRKTNEDKN